MAEKGRTPDPLDALHGDEPPVAPMLQMDGIRIATLVVLAANTVAVILLATFLITSSQNQREINECYQDAVDGLLAYVTTARETTASDRQVVRELLVAIVESGDPRATAARGLDRIAEIDRTRAQNLPPAQRCTR